MLDERHVSGHWWNSPIFVVPVALATLGLVMVPFAVWNTDHAAQFYGSLTAAFVAAGAVIGTTALQARLARQQRREEAQAESLAESIELYAWMASLAADIEYPANVLLGWIERPPEGQLTLKDFRLTVPQEARTRLRNRLSIASRLPSPLGHDIVSALHLADSLFDLVAMPRLPEEYPVGIEEQTRRQKKATFVASLIEWRRAQLGKYLFEQSAMSVFPDEQRAVLEAGPPREQS